MPSLPAAFAASTPAALLISIRSSRSRIMPIHRPIVRRVTAAPSEPPIVGATKEHHLEDAIAAADLELDDDELAALEEHYVPHAVTGF